MRVLKIRRVIENVLLTQRLTTRVIIRNLTRIETVGGFGIENRNGETTRIPTVGGLGNMNRSRKITRIATVGGLGNENRNRKIASIVNYQL